MDTARGVRHTAPEAV